MTPLPVHENDNDEHSSALRMCQAARQLWLTATTKADLQRVEQLYSRAVKRRQAVVHQQSSSNSSSSGSSISRKKRKTTQPELEPEEYRLALERLALLYVQSQRADKAAPGLEELGYTCRLASSCLDYPLQQPTNISRTKVIPPCILCDNFLSKAQQDHLQAILQDRQSAYWVDHAYAVEPPSPYFSYVMPLEDAAKYGFLGTLIQQIYTSPNLNIKFARLKDAAFVELWLHNRPHASGHQMHFDSDNEGRGGVRNPIVSTILYVTADTGGPSLVTNQTLANTNLATKGWLCHPAKQRLVAFDGKVLHGVVPGKGVKTGRRVTLMLAFWKNIRIRKGDGPGAARPFPQQGKDIPEWLRLFQAKIPETDKREKEAAIVESLPIELDRVYETLAGEKWTRPMGMPEYDEVFQGF